MVEKIKKLSCYHCDSDNILRYGFDSIKGMSLRGIERKFKVCRQTVSGWLKNKAKEKDLKDTLV